MQVINVKGLLAPGVKCKSPAVAGLVDLVCFYCSGCVKGLGSASC